MRFDFKFNPKTISPDLGSGLTMAFVSIPEGMAYAMVAGVLRAINLLVTGWAPTQPIPSKIRR